MSKKPVVLIVEDDVAEQVKARDLLSPHAEVLIAGWQKEAFILSKDRPDIAYVILDGYVPMFESKSRGIDTTVGFALRLRITHRNVRIFSASSDKDMNERLVKFGAVRANKQTAAGLVRDEILKNT